MGTPDRLQHRHRKKKLDQHDDLLLLLLLRPHRVGLRRVHVRVLLPVGPDLRGVPGEVHQDAGTVQGARAGQEVPGDQAQEVSVYSVTGCAGKKKC